MSHVSQPPAVLMAVPNVSEGRDLATVEAISHALSSRGEAAARTGGQAGGEARREESGEPDAAGRGMEVQAGEGVRLLDVHSDADHHRTVYTLAGAPGALCRALVRGAREAVARIDVMTGADGSEPRGAHPHVGALDVAPVVYLEESMRGAAFAHALVAADRIGDELQVPVFLYGELAGGRTRAQLRSGGVAGLGRRIAAGELCPDFGPPRLHPRAGATLLAAREPLVAFNLRLAAPATLADARRVAGRVRESGAEGLAGVRAIGVELGGSAAQVSMNVERPLEVPLALVIERVRAHARIAAGELVGLAPRAALAGFPDDVPLPGFDPARHVIERVLGLEP